MSRLELEGELHRIRRQRLEISSLVTTKAKALKDILDKVAIRQVQEIDFEGAAAIASELKDIKKRVRAFIEKEAEIQKELE